MTHPPTNKPLLGIDFDGKIQETLSTLRVIFYRFPQKGASLIAAYCTKNEAARVKLEKALRTDLQNNAPQHHSVDDICTMLNILRQKAEKYPKLADYLCTTLIESSAKQAETADFFSQGR